MADEAVLNKVQKSIQKIAKNIDTDVREITLFKFDYRTDSIQSSLRYNTYSGKTRGPIPHISLEMPLVFLSANVAKTGKTIVICYPRGKSYESKTSVITDLDNCQR